MADYHPLDVRYKGPSTAYRGSAKKKALETAPAVTPQQPKPKPQTRPKAGPWGSAAPPPLPHPGHVKTTTPPPVPVPRRKLARHVLFGFIILITVVFVNVFVARVPGSINF